MKKLLCKLGLHEYHAILPIITTLLTVRYPYRCKHCGKLKIKESERVQYE